MARPRDLELINLGASFEPQQVGDMTRPCLTVAGVQVYAFVVTTDLLEGPKLVVSIDYDTAGHSEHTAGSPSTLGCENDGELLGWPMDESTGEGIPTEVRVGPSLRLTLDREGSMALVADR